MLLLCDVWENRDISEQDETWVDQRIGLEGSFLFFFLTRTVFLVPKLDWPELLCESPCTSISPVWVWSAMDP